MDVFHLAGLKIESLLNFLSKYDFHLSEQSLKNIFLAHITSEQKPIKKFVVTDLHDEAQLTIPAPAPYLHVLKPARIFEAIVNTVKSSTILTYIFTKCYIFIRWENGSFESIEDCDLNSRLSSLKSAKRPRSNQDLPKSLSCKKLRDESGLQIPSKSDNSQPEKHQTRLPRRKHRDKLYKNDKASNTSMVQTVETISLDPILYDSKQRDTVLNVKSVDELLKEIIQLPLLTKSSMLDEWLRASSSWISLRQILHTFLNRESLIVENDGYNRILQKHLHDTPETPNWATGLKPPIDKRKIVSYICDVLRRVLPLEIFGNKNRLKKKWFLAIKKLIYGAKQQKFSLQLFVVCFEPYLEWRLEMSPYFQHLMTLKLIKFLVMEYILKVLKKLFYVTECGSSGYELFYYMKGNVESVMVKKVKDMLKLRKLEEVSDTDDCVERRWLDRSLDHKDGVCLRSDDLMQPHCEYALPVVKLRLLPKSRNGGEFRLITIRSYCHKATLPFPNKLLTERERVRKKNMVLVKQFLDCILGAVGTGIKPIHSSPQLKDFWHKVIQMKKDTGKKLFFVKADIADAFGSVNHSRLLNILNQFCNNMSQCEELELREWIVRRGKLQIVSRCSYSRRVASNRVLHSRLPSMRGNQSPTFLKDIIRQIVSLQRVRICRKLYRVTEGLCQGGAGMLSTRLCDVYLTALDLSHFNRFIHEGHTVLLRGVDDYLLVTVDRSRALEFYSVLQKGVSKYNIHCSNKKLVTNLFEECPMFSYLGLNFDIEQLNVQPEYSRYIANDVINYVKLNCAMSYPSLKVSSFLSKKSLDIKPLKMTQIVLEGDIKHVRCVISKGCHLHATKILALALNLQTVRAVLEQALLQAANKLRHMFSGMTTLVTNEEIQYIYWQNVYKVFQRHSGNFKGLVKYIQMKIVRLHRSFQEKGSLFQRIYFDLMETLENLDWWHPWKKHE